MVTIEKQKYISVVIPTYNRGYCLSRAINSVLRQTAPVMEIIIVDDGSSDDTCGLLRDYGFLDDCDGPVQKKFLQQKNKGVSAARNLGIRHSKGDFIAFLDSDDAWHECKLEKQITALVENHWKAKVVHTDEIWIRNGRRVNPGKKHLKSGGYIFEKCLPLCCISPSSVLLNRSVFDDYGWFDETLPACEDYDMWLRITAFEEVLFIPDALTIKYGGHDDQLSRAHWGLDRFRVKALEKLLSCQLLSNSQRDITISTLIEKLSILATGARKRDKLCDASKYESLKTYWEKARYFG